VPNYEDDIVKKGKREGGLPRELMPKMKKSMDLSSDMPVIKAEAIR